MANAGTAGELMRFMLRDKKTEAGKLTLILVKAIGEAHIVKAADASEILSFLEEKITL
ncbi:MAG: hypothetical protein GXP04_06995 [Alphaproteobacteria bacterium]|nr:hypothetical protein [Alphaproteobacteria bacterium]